MNSLPANASSTPDREFLYHVFHLISQPVTALQCSLELALIGNAELEECRSSIEYALENAERLRRRLLLVREMADACDAGNVDCPVDIEEVLEEAMERLQPLLESTGQMPELRLTRVLVVGERSRLSRAFLYLLESLLGSAAAEGSTNSRVCLKQECSRVVVHVTGFRSTELDKGNRAMSAELEIARRTFEAVGGSLSLTQNFLGEWGCEVLLQAAPVREAQIVGEQRTIGNRPQFS
jgi:hypothetical protein